MTSWGVMASDALFVAKWIASSWPDITGAQA
jgi:hypothetical protein